MTQFFKDKGSTAKAVDPFMVSPLTGYCYYSSVFSSSAGTSSTGASTAGASSTGAKNKLSAERLKRLRVFEGAEHDHAAQNPKEIK